MKNIIVSFVIGFILGCVGMWIWKKCDAIPVDIPIKIEVPVPPVKDSFPSVTPKPIHIPVPNPINKKLKGELDRANDIIDSLKIYKEFVVKRHYNEKFEDSIQTIFVNMEATGTVDKVDVKYEQKPRTIVVDTVIPIELPKSLDRAINVYLEGGIPFKNNVDTNFQYKVGVDIVNKKNIIYGVSYAPQLKYIYGKIGYQFKH